jgi:hypothetical protein
MARAKKEDVVIEEKADVITEELPAETAVEAPKETKVLSENKIEGNTVEELRRSIRKILI